MTPLHRPAVLGLALAVAAPAAVAHTPAEAPAPIFRSAQDNQWEEDTYVVGRYTHQGPTRYTRDPVFGDTIYGGTAAPREAAELTQPVAFRIGLSVLSVGESDLDDRDGDVEVNRGGGDLGLDIGLGQGAGLSLNGAFEASRYNFDGVSGSTFGTADPFRTVYIASLSASMWKDFGDTFSAFGTFAFGSGWVEGTEPAEGQSYLVSAGGAAHLSPGLYLGLAAVAIDRLEKGMAYLAYPVIDWRIAPEWRLTTAETGLPGVGLFFEPDSRFAIYAAAGAELRQFRASSLGTPVLIDEPAVHDKRIRVSGGIRWRAGANVILWTEGGAYPYAQIEAFDDAGNTVAKENLETSLFASARLQITF
jgi:hypothetical protein